MAYPGTRQFICSQCGKSFRRKADLKRHAGIHDPDAGRFRCPFLHCTYNTLQKGNVITHYISRHTDLRPHHCRFQGCTKSYADGSARIRHEKREHGYFHRSHEACKKQGECSGAALSPSLGIPPPSASSKEVKKEVNLAGIRSLQSLGNSGETAIFPVSSASSISPIASLETILEPMPYNWSSFGPQFTLGGFHERGPKSPIDAGQAEQGSNLWPEPTPQSYFSKLWLSASPSDIPSWFPPDAL